MIRIETSFAARGPLHTGSDISSGTLKSLRRQRCVLRNPVAYTSRLSEDARRDAMTHILLGVWYRMDWDSIKGKRLMGIWDEFANKLAAAGRAGDKYKFLDTLCRSWGIESLINPNVAVALDALSDYELFDMVRNESLYLVLKLRALKDQAREHKGEDGRLTFDLPPVLPGEPIAVVRTEDLVPCISGNSIRGKMRRLAMADFCRQVGITRMDKRTYHTLFTGGFLDQSTTYEDFDRMEQFVTMCPMLGVLGAAIGNMTIEGEAKIGWAYPRCRERGTGLDSYWQVLDTVFQTRKDSSKTETELELTGDDRTQQMKYEYEVFADGTVFDWVLACTSRDDLLTSAWWHMLSLFDRSPYIGGMGSVGNGEISLDWELVHAAGDSYLDHLAVRREEIKNFWETTVV